MSATAGVRLHTVTVERIFHTWWPLAASWLLMGAEGPAINAVIARLADPKIHLAAYGGVVFPTSLLIESPIIMLLAASTALSKDWASYARVRRYMMIMGAVLTALHALVAFTPLYDLLVVTALHPPAEVIEPARIGLMIMLPWTWSIAFRRFNQGVLIRFGHSRTIWVGTLIRLATDVLVLIIGYSIHTIPGIIVGAGAVASGVIAEAVYVGIVVRPVLKNELKIVPALAEPLTFPGFIHFYIPLVMTALLTMVIQPMGSAAMGRMPQPLDSLATWPIVWGLAFLLRSMGVAFNEVVVAILDETGSTAPLARFAWLLAGLLTLLLLLVAATPLASAWFVDLYRLTPDLARLARQTLWIALPLPGLTVFQSWFQGAILHGRHTRHVTESVIFFLVLSGILLSVGVAWGRLPGLSVAMGSFVISTAAQTAWLWMRSRPVIAASRQRDRTAPLNEPAQ